MPWPGSGADAVAAVFLFGTLRHAPLLAAVLGRGDPATRPAVLPGHAVRRAKGEVFPLLVEMPGVNAEGVLLEDPSAEDLARLDLYEGAFGYGRVAVTVEAGGAPLAAEVYRAGARWDPDGPWDLAGWIAARGEIETRAAAEQMARFPGIGAGELAHVLEMARGRAASGLRAAEMARPATVRSAQGVDRVRVADRRRPYTGFFTVEEADLAFPRFDGTTSETVTRAAFGMADAVTVLPYDPVRDRVLVIEQFRFAPYVRGDRRPWCLEPIAGRIDAGETPEDAARREALEEAGLALGRLEIISRYYPSPGAVSEYLFSYLALCDLPDGTAGLGGVANEAEDIRGHVLPFDAMMELIATGEIEVGPLILSAFWLSRHRDRLRRAA